MARATESRFHNLRTSRDYLFPEPPRKHGMDDNPRAIWKACQLRRNQSTSCRTPKSETCATCPTSVDAMCESFLYSESPAYLKAVTLIAELRSIFETPPPPYPETLDDQPPDYGPQDADVARARVDAGVSAPAHINKKEKNPAKRSILPDPNLGGYVDFDDTSCFRQAKKKKGGPKKGGGGGGGGQKDDDNWPENNDTAGGGQGDGAAGGDGGDGGGDGGGAGDGGGGGGGDDGWNDDDWTMGGGKKKKGKKARKEEEDRKRREEEEAEEKRKEEEQQKEEEFGAAGSLNWADEMDEADMGDEWPGGFTTATKKKKKKGKSGLEPEDTSNAFDTIDLDDGAPQLDLSFDVGDKKSSANNFGFGGWGKDWNTGSSRFAFGTEDADHGAKDNNDIGSNNPWATGGTKKGKKKSTAMTNAFDIGALGDLGDDNNAESKPPEDDSWDVATSKKDGKKKKGAAADPLIAEHEPGFPRPPAEADPTDTWEGGWATTGKDKKKKKKGLAAEPLEPPKEELKAVQPEAAADDLWSFSTKKDKKKTGKVEPEPTPTDGNLWADIPARKGKTKKGKGATEEPALPADEPKPTPMEEAQKDDFDFWPAMNKKDRKKKAKADAAATAAAAAAVPEEPENTAKPEAWREEVEPVDEWAWTDAKKKKKNGKTALEEDPPPQPQESLPDEWATAGKKTKKKGRNVVEEAPLAAAPLSAEPETTEDWFGFPTDSKNKKGKKAGDEIQDSAPSGRVPVGGWGGWGMTDTKKKTGKNAVDEQTSQKQQESESVDAWTEPKAGKTKKTPTTRKGVVEETPAAKNKKSVGNDDDFWSSLVSSSKNKKDKKDEPADADFFDNLLDDVGYGAKTDGLGADDSQWGGWSTGTKKNDKKTLKTAAGTSPPQNDWFGGLGANGTKKNSLSARPEATTTATTKKDTKKDSQKDDLLDMDQQPNDGRGVWGFGKSTRTSAAKKSSKTTDLVEPIPEPVAAATVDEPASTAWGDDWGLSSKDKKKREREAKKKGTSTAANDTPAKGAEPVSTDLVPTKSAENDSWDIWGSATKAKKGKKGKASTELPPPAPTPPAHELGPEPTDIPDLDLGDDSWATGGGEANAPKKGRTATSSSKVGDGKLSKTKARGLQVEDVTDSPKSDAPAAKTTKGFWGSFGLGGTTTTTTTSNKTKLGKLKEEKEKTTPTKEEEAEAEKASKSKDVNKSSTKKGKADAIDDLLADPEPEAASAGAADKAPPPAQKKNTSTSSSRPAAKSSVADKVRQLEQNKKADRETTKDKDRENENESQKQASKTKKTADSPPHAARPADDPLDQPSPRPDAAASKKAAATTTTSKTKAATKATTAAKSKTSTPATGTAKATGGAADGAKTPRDSVPGSFPGAQDDLVDLDDPGTGPAKPDPKSKTTKTSKTQAKKAASPEKPDTAEAMAISPSGGAKNGEAGGQSKPAKKERARVERTAGASSWGFWGTTAPKKPAKRDTRSKDDAGPAEPKKETSPVKRSKSTSAKKDPNAKKEVEKSSASDKDDNKKGTAARSSRHAKGMSFSNFVMGSGPPPTRTKSNRKPTSKRQSVDIDSSGVRPPAGRDGVPDKAAKVMGINGTAHSKRDKEKRRASAPPDHPLDDDMVMVNGGDSPGEDPKPDKPNRRKSKHSKAKAGQDDPVMVEPGSSGQGPDVHSGPDDMAFVDHPPKDRLKRPNPAPKKPEQGGIMGFLGSLRKSRAPETTKDHKFRPHREEEPKRATDNERANRHRKRRPTKNDTDGEGLTTDAGPATETEDAEVKRAERKTKRASKMDAEQDVHDAEERRAKRKESQKTKAREEREKRAREEEEREERRREEKKARRAARQSRADAAEEALNREAEARAARRREKRRTREPQDANDEDNRNDHKSGHRHHSYAGEKPHDKHSGDEPRNHRHHRSGDEAKSKRRRSTAEDRHHTSRSRQPADTTPYPAMTNGNKNDKISSWVNSQMTDPPEAPPIVPTVIDDPAPADDPNSHTLSSDEEARKTRHRRSKRQSKHTGDLPARHRKEREPMRSSDDDYEADRYAHANGNAKRTSWFKKFAPF